MIEIILIVALIFAVLVFFYKQGIVDYNILQIDATQLSELPRLLNEKAPIVIKGIGQPKLFTPDILKLNQRILTYPLSTNINLGQYLFNKNGNENQNNFSMTSRAATILANEIGLQIWFKHMWFSKIFSNSLWETLYKLNTEAYVGEKGLSKMNAAVTFIYPTYGNLEITLLTENQSVFLPSKWKGCFPENLTIQDNPLVGEIKFITVILRPGNILSIPTHWYMSIKCINKDKICLWSKINIHHPISNLSAYLDKNES